MTDRVFSVVAVVGLLVLAFLAGGYVVLAQRFPYEPLEHAYRAGKAVLAQQRELGDHYATDLWQKARTDRRGVVVLDAGRVQPGYTLYTSGHDQRALLISLDGRVLHEWSKPYSEVWDDTAVVRKPVPDRRTYFRNTWMYPNGDLLALYDGVGDTPHGYGLIKLNKDSRVIWKYLQRAHHDVDVAPDGRIYTLTHEIEQDEFEPRKNLKPPRIDDYLVELSADGVQLRRVRLLNALGRSNYVRMLDTLPGYLAASGDYLHTNNVDYIDADAAARFGFKEGQVLLSMREPGAIAVLDLDQQTVVWALRGAWVGQHDPDLLPNGNILLFDNNGHFGPGGRSQVLEIDPRSEGIVWRYAGTEQRRFESIIRSVQQRLPNGNTLITESDGGRLLEVTSGGDVVWEYVNPVRAGSADELIPIVSGGRRIDPASLDPGFRQSLETAQRRSAT